MKKTFLGASHAAAGIAGVALLVAGVILAVMPDLPSLEIEPAPAPTAQSQDPVSVPVAMPSNQRPAISFWHFTDANLERVIREAIGDSDGSISQTALSNLLTIDAPNQQIESLDGIEDCAQLRHLNLSANRVTDLSVLGNLLRLETVDLSDNDLGNSSNLDEIGHCTQLHSLNLSGNRISNIAFVERLLALSTVDLSDNRIRDLLPLVENGGLGDGDHIDLRGNPLDLTPGSEHQLAIQSLEERGVWVQPHAGAPTARIPDARLEAALLEAVGQSDGTILIDDLAEILLLAVGDESIELLQGLQHLRQIRELDLSGNRIRDCSVIGSLYKLRELNLSENAIQDVTPVLGLTSLSTIDLSSNAIADISAEWKSGGLIVVHLDDNEIASLDPLSTLKGLRVLTVSGNRITDLGPLSGFQFLTRLEARGNQIEDISLLGGLAALKELDVSGNQITDISPLLRSRSLRNGARVDLRGNPLDVHAGSETMDHIQTLIGRGVEVFY